MNVRKIIIGSAQFGMDYGIANQHGQVQEKEISKILHYALSQQIHLIDTATSYGESEKRLGQLADSNFRIITKIPAIHPSVDNGARFVRNYYTASLNKLRKGKCYGLLVHRAEDLLSPKGKQIYEAMAELKEEKKVEKIGVSVYSPEQVDALMQSFQLDIIQFPLNLLDQRFIQHKLLNYLKHRDVELHARGIFLQGLLLMPYENIPDYFIKIKPLLFSLKRLCNDKGINLRQALLKFAFSLKVVDHFVFGIDTCEQLIEITHDLMNAHRGCEDIKFENYACDDLKIIDPRRWHTL